MKAPSKTFIQVLRESHIPAIAIALFLMWSLDWSFRALWRLFVPATDFLIAAVAILGLPYISPSRSPIIWVFVALGFFNAFMNLAAAWILSRWVYGVGPLRVLSGYRSRMPRRIND
jgi:hypothetical protein